MKRYTLGTLVRMTLAVNAQVIPPTIPPTSGAPVAATVSAKLTDPAGVVHVLTVVTDAVGVYHADYTTAQLGVHRYEFLCTGGAVVNGVSQFLVDEAVF